MPAPRVRPLPATPARRLPRWLAAGLLVALLAALVGGGLRVTRSLAQQGPEHAFLPNVQRDHEPAQEATPTLPPATATVTPTPPPRDPDALGEALAVLGLDRSALGFRPRGDWTRWPLMERTRFMLPMFQPIFAEPLRAYDAARTMGNAADRFLRPEALAGADLFRATYYLGVDRKAGNLRDYSANVYIGHLAEAAPEEPLRVAIRELYAYAREELVSYSFGGIPSSPDVEALMDDQLADVPEGIRREVALGVRNQLEALRWRDRALRNVDPELARRAFAIRDLGDTQGAGETWYPSLEEVAGALDEPSLYYGAQRLVETGQRLRLGVAALEDADRCPADLIDIPTPFGRVLVGTCGADLLQGDDVLLAVDPGGDDTHAHNAGGTARIETGAALAVDVAGDDVWDCSAIVDGACQGAGVLGLGVLVDGVGQDTYLAAHSAQGFGQLGAGVLVDADGADGYELAHAGQGAAFFGYGALLDGAGNDSYTILFDGQGYGGVGGGVGVLADYAGDDRYRAEPEVAQVPAAYRYRNYAGNGQPNTMVSFVQGVAAGRRADGSDGHAWPGGLGAIIDVHGDDHYTAGAFAQGYGYWYGIGLVYDGEGDDQYRSVYYSIASGAHYSVSAVVDEAGDDVYAQEEAFDGARAGAGVAFAWDYVTALLADKAGNDRYESGVNCLGRTAENGQALLVDGGGQDVYVAMSQGSCLGSSSWRSYRSGDPYRQYLTGAETDVIALLLDLGGPDQYVLRDRASGEETAHPLARDDNLWTNPDPDALSSVGTTYRYARTFGLGVDRADGVVPELHRIPAPAPPVDEGGSGLDMLRDMPPMDAVHDGAEPADDYRVDPFDAQPRVPPAPPEEEGAAGATGR